MVLAPARPAVLAVLVCSLVLGLAGCSRGDEHAQQACKDADFYRHGVCMWGVGCTPPGSPEVAQLAISEALQSSTSALHDPVAAQSGSEQQLAAIFEYCGTKP